MGDFLSGILDAIMAGLTAVDDFLYYPVLIVVLLAAGIYFTIRTGFVQVRLFKESIRVVTDRAPKADSVSSFQALMVSTASRVGTGNIVGVSTAICLGGPGAIFWMWVVAILGGASAFIESTLAQLYKRRGTDGNSYGGPSFYIKHGIHNPVLAAVFAVCLIATYAIGFNMLASYNLQTTFSGYGFYDADVTPIIIGAVLALLVLVCLLGGGKRIIKVTSAVVPAMGIAYVLIALVVTFANIPAIPAVLGAVFTNAFDFPAIFGGIAGSCLVYGIKRGLYSNEAGVGSAPNAAASADVSHPVKQGLVQMLSVFIDTLLLCSATAFMCLLSGVAPSADIAGAPYAQAAAATVFGGLGPILITGIMVVFAFTTLLGNLFYVDNALDFLHGGKTPSRAFMTVYRVLAALVIFVGAIVSMDAAWAIADITMGIMALINIPVICILGGKALTAYQDYVAQRKTGVDPVFNARACGMDTTDLDYWK